MQYVDITVVCIYLVACLIIGFNKVSGIKNIREYALGNTVIPTTALFATLFATYIGAGSTVGNIEKIHSEGLIYAVGMLSFPLIWITSRWVFSDNINYFKEKGCMSTSDIMEVMYGKPARWVTNFMYIFMVLGVLAMQGTAIAYLLDYFFGIEKKVALIMGLGVLTLYSTLGGIRAVVATDIFQSFVLFVGIPAACFTAYYELGGYNELIEHLPQTHKSFEINQSNVVTLFTLLIYCSLPLSSSSFIQRYLMARDNNQLKKALYANSLISIPFVLIIVLVGLIVKAKAPEINSNVAFFYLIDNHLPVLIKGLVISGILAAIMSTADSWLNTASITIAHDVVKKIFPQITDKTEIRIAQISTIILGALAGFFALLDNKSVLEIEWLVANFWESIILVPLAAGFLKHRTNTTSFITGISIGFVTVLVARFITGEFATISLFIGGTGTYIGLLLGNVIKDKYSKKNQFKNNFLEPSNSGSQI